MVSESLSAHRDVPTAPLFQRAGSRPELVLNLQVGALLYVESCLMRASNLKAPSLLKPVPIGAMRVAGVGLSDSYL
jgi:hypothetical protein